MIGGLYFKQIRREKDMLLKSMAAKLVRYGRYDFYHKRSIQVIKRNNRRFGVAQNEI